MFDNYCFYSSTTPEFATAFTNFMPQWLESLVPYYEAARRNGIELVGLNRVLDSSKDPAAKLMDNNIMYHVSGIPGYCTSMAVSADFEGEVPGNWRCEFRKVFNEPENINNIWNFCAYNHYTSRISNTKAPYDVLANDVRDYFILITGDPDVVFSFSHSSYICLSKRAERLVMANYMFD